MILKNQKPTRSGRTIQPTSKHEPQRIEIGDSICTLVNHAREGCGDSKSELLNQLRSYMQIVAASRMNSKFQAKFGESDIVQQSIAVAMEKFEHFRGSSEGELLAWVKKILQNEFLQQQRALLSDKRDMFREQSLEPTDPSATYEFGIVDHQLTPKTNAIQNERATAVAAAMERLPDDYREVIQLRNQDQLPFGEIAARMNRTVNAVTKLWYRALIQLRSELEVRDV